MTFCRVLYLLFLYLFPYFDFKSKNYKYSVSNLQFQIMFQVVFQIIVSSAALRPWLCERQFPSSITSWETRHALAREALLKALEPADILSLPRQRRSHLGTSQ